MPYASEAQRRKFHYLLSVDKISPEVVREFDEASKGLKLPERLHPKKTAPEAKTALYTVKAADTAPLMQRFSELSPRGARARELSDRLAASAPVPVRYEDNPLTASNVAYYDSLNREVNVGSKGSRMPSLIAHELGHAEGHQQGNFIERALHSRAGRVAGLGVGMLGGYAAGAIPKKWSHKLLAGAATTAVGAGSVYGAEALAGHRSHRLLEQAGATPGELDANRLFQQTARRSYLPVVVPMAAFPLLGAAAGTGLRMITKRAAHAHDRMSERTEFDPSNVAKIQKLVDAMNLAAGSYHLPLRDPSGGVGGYAVFKGVKNRKLPVLATILAKDMRPSGSDIEPLFKAPVPLTPKAS